MCWSTALASSRSRGSSRITRRSSGGHWLSSASARAISMMSSRRCTEEWPAGSPRSTRPWRRSRRQPCEDGCLVSASVRRPVIGARCSSGEKCCSRIKSSTARPPRSPSRTCSPLRSDSPCSDIYFRAWTPLAAPWSSPTRSMVCAWSISPRLSASRSIPPGTGCASPGRTCARPGSGWPATGRAPVIAIPGDWTPAPPPPSAPCRSARPPSPRHAPARPPHPSGRRSAPSRR